MSDIEEYVDKIGRISSEYKQLSRENALLDDDGEISADEIKERKINIYKYIKRKAIKCEDPRIAIAVLEFTPKMFKYLPNRFKQNKEFFLNTLKELENPRMLKYADEVLQSDLDCCLAALRLEYRLINYISADLKSNQDILDTYAWSREIQKLPKNLPQIDLSKCEPDSDDIYFYDNKTPKTQQETKQPSTEEEAQILEQLELDGATLTIATEKEQVKNKKRKQEHEEKPIHNDLIDEETIAWGDDDTQYDDDDDEDDGIIHRKENEEEDEDDLPQVKNKEKKGFFAKLFG